MAREGRVDAHHNDRNAATIVQKLHTKVMGITDIRPLPISEVLRFDRLCDLLNRKACQEADAVAPKSLDA